MIVETIAFRESRFELPCFIGKKPTNETFRFDLAELPHLLISGASGQGKSLCIHDIIMSLLFKKHPNEVKFVMVDYKKIEFSCYESIKDHFMACPEEDEGNPIISNDEQAKRTFRLLKVEFDRRFKLLSMAKSRNIKEYNTIYCNHLLNLHDGHIYLPYIVIIIDEYTNLIAENKQVIEPIILELAKKGRAVGIHLIIGTNRPSTDVIDSGITMELRGRLAFKVNNVSDSKLIIDRNGAEKLFAPGDALFKNNSGTLQRVQCTEVKYEEIDCVCDFVSKQAGPLQPYYLKEFEEDKQHVYEHESDSQYTGGLDPMFVQAACAIVATQQASTSMIQRRFSIGYNRAGRLMDQLEKAGIVGKAEGSKPREVLFADENSLFAYLQELAS